MSPRRQLGFWIAAVVLTVMPLGVLLLQALVSGAAGVELGVVGRCQGWEVQASLWRVPGLGYLRGLPILVVGPAFAVWTRTRWPWFAWATSGLLAVNALIEPVLLAYDVVGETACWQMWEPFADWMGWQVWYLVPAVLIAATVVRWGWGLRGVVGVAVLAPVFVVAGDSGRVDVVAADCQGAKFARPARDESWVQAIGRMSPADRERAFLCSVRGEPFGSYRRVDGRADGELLWLGRRACTGKGFERRLFVQFPAEPGRVLSYLCPDRAGPALTRSQKDVDRENARRDARVNAHCRKRAPRGVTRAVFTSDGGGYYVGEFDSSAMFTAIDDGLVGVRRNGVAVTTAEHQEFCLTVRRLNTRPPVEREGWDRVVEVGIDASEPVTITTMTEEVFSSLGRGSLRIRIHVRDAGEHFSELPRERHLVEVFPGNSKKTVVY